MIKKRTLKALAAMAAFWLMMFFAFYDGKEWAQNIVLVFLWIMCPMVVFIAYIGELANDLRQKGRALPDWLNITDSIAVFFILAGSGWLWTAALWVITEMHGAYIYDKDRR